MCRVDVFNKFFMLQELLAAYVALKVLHGQVASTVCLGCSKGSEPLVTELTYIWLLVEVDPQVHRHGDLRAAYPSANGARQLALTGRVCIVMPVNCVCLQATGKLELLLALWALMAGAVAFHTRQLPFSALRV